MLLSLPLPSLSHKQLFHLSPWCNVHSSLPYNNLTFSVLSAVSEVIGKVLRQVSSSILVRIANVHWVQYIIIPTINIIPSISTCPWKVDFVVPPWGKRYTVRDAHQNSWSFFLRHNCTHLLWLSGGHMTSCSWSISLPLQVLWALLSLWQRDPNNGCVFCFSPQTRTKMRWRTNLWWTRDKSLLFQTSRM